MVQPAKGRLANILCGAGCWSVGTGERETGLATSGSQTNTPVTTAAIARRMSLHIALLLSPTFRT